MPASVLARVEQPEPLEDLAAGLRDRALRLAAAIDRADEQVLEHGEFLERLRDLMGAADAGAAASLRRHAGEIAAVEADGAGVGARPPAIRLNSVVLPAPFGPMMPTASPGAIARSRSSATMIEPKLFS